MVTLASIAPFFIVSDVKKSAAFYVNQLGFEIRYIGPENNPFFAIVGRDQISIMLKAIAADVKPTPNHIRHEWARWDAFISVADPDALFAEYVSKGINFQQKLQDDGDGLSGFEVKDFDGYVLFFGRPKA